MRLVYWFVIYFLTFLYHCSGLKEVLCFKHISDYYLQLTKQKNKVSDIVQLIWFKTHSRRECLAINRLNIRQTNY